MSPGLFLHSSLIFDDFQEGFRFRQGPQYLPGRALGQFLIGIAAGGHADRAGADGFAALDVVRRVADDISHLDGIAPGFLGDGQGIAGQIIAIVIIEGEPRMREIEVLGQAEDVHLHAGADGAVAGQEELPVILSLLEESQVLFYVGQDNAFFGLALQPFQELLFIAPAKGMDFIVCRHDACSFIQELLADEIIRPAAGGDFRHGHVGALEVVEDFFNGVQTGPARIQ